VAVIGVRPRDEKAYTKLRDHVAEIVAQYGMCEMTTEAFRYGSALETVEMSAVEMSAHITDVISGKARLMEPGPRNVTEFLQQMALEMGCKMYHPTERPWNVVFERLPLCTA